MEYGADYCRKYSVIILTLLYTYLINKAINPITAAPTKPCKKTSIPFIILTFNINIQNMPRRKGSPNKVTSEVKEQLQNLIDEVVNSIDVNSMDTNQKLKLLQLSLHYVIPKLRSTETIEKPYEDLPLFID
ncbi:hypothetical protein N9V61_04990 [Flavobacteriaceae bacterium]|nr:hypothetical protein [Flavobacteriaceae bacterium]